MNARRAATRIAIALLLAASPHPGTAQAPGAHRQGAILSLALWADGVWLSLTDRDGSYFGRLAEQGTFQRFNAQIHDEYELDLRSGLFSERDDVHWAVAQRGLRVASASINPRFSLTVADWRERVPITDRVQLVARYRREHSLTAQRDYPTVGIAWTPSRLAPWELGVGVGVHFFKSSADVEFSGRRHWTRSRDTFALDVRVAVLDAFSDVSNALGDDEPDILPAHFRFDVQPLAARLALTWSASTARAELHAGASNRSAVAVTFPGYNEPGYDQVEHVNFAGALGEWAPTARVRLAAFATTALAATDRRFDSAARARGYRLRERTQVAGARGAATLRGPFLAEFGVDRVWRPEQRDRDGGTAERHDDRETLAHIALRRRPVSGTTFRLLYLIDDRSAGVLAPWLSAENQRMNFEYGYRFRRGFEATLGVRWDVDDHRPATRFGGGHVRFSTTW